MWWSCIGRVSCLGEYIYKREKKRQRKRQRKRTRNIYIYIGDPATTNEVTTVLLPQLNSAVEEALEEVEEEKITVRRV